MPRRVFIVHGFEGNPHGNWQRYIVHLKFESWTPKDTGVPAELVDEPTN